MSKINIEKQVVTVLCYDTLEVLVFCYNQADLDISNITIEEFLEAKGINISNCHYMCSDSLNLIIK